MKSFNLLFGENLSPEEIMSRLFEMTPEKYIYGENGSIEIEKESLFQVSLKEEFGFGCGRYKVRYLFDKNPNAEYKTIVEIIPKVKDFEKINILDVAYHALDQSKYLLYSYFGDLKSLKSSEEGVFKKSDKGLVYTSIYPSKKKPWLTSGGTLIIKIKNIPKPIDYTVTALNLNVIRTGYAVNQKIINEQE